MKRFSISAGVIAFLAVSIFLISVGFSFWRRELPKPSSQTPPQSPPSSSQTRIVGWKTCKDVIYGYEVKYPPNWETYAPGPPEARHANCSAHLGMVLFTPDLYGSEHFTMYVYDRGGAKGTNYEEVKSIDDYFVKNPEELKLVTKETTTDGERLVWLGKNSAVMIHKGVVFEFVIQNVDDRFMYTFLKTFKFLR